MDKCGCLADNEGNKGIVKTGIVSDSCMEK